MRTREVTRKLGSLAEWPRAAVCKEPPRQHLCGWVEHVNPPKGCSEIHGEGLCSLQSGSLRYNFHLCMKERTYPLKGLTPSEE